MEHKLRREQDEKKPKALKSKAKSNVSNYIENGDFETGDFTGWTLMDGTTIGSYRQSRFNDSEFPYVGKGSWADMGRYFVDLSDYIGEPLYIELSDSKINGPWASAIRDIWLSVVQIMVAA